MTQTHQPYSTFYREVGVRRFGELLSPRLAPFRGLPRDTILHHLSQDDAMFPDADKPYFQDYNRRLPMDLIYRSNQMEGHPRELPFVPQKYVLPFIKKHHQFRYVKDAAETPVDDRTLVVLNYNTLKYAYKYVHTPISDYQQWEGFQKTFWKNIGELSVKTNKYQFVIMEPFTQIPSFNLLLNFSNKEGLTLAKLFNHHDKRFILHLTNFIMDESRYRSIFNLIPLEGLKKVNIVFILKDGRCSVLNLAYLYSWIKGDENVTGVKISFQRDQKMVIRAILKYFLVLSSAVPEEVSEDLQGQNEIQEDPERDEEEQEVEDLDDEEKDRKPSYSTVTGLVPKSRQEDHSHRQGLKKESEVEDLSINIVNSLNDDLEVLEKQNRDELNRRGLTIKNNQVVEIDASTKQKSYEVVHKEIYTSLQPHKALAVKLEKALADGTLNAASYKKALQDADKYTKMTDPYGGTALVAEQVKINPTELLIKPEKTKLRDHATILDKSMTSSALQDFTSGYIENHHRKDILKMVGALQKGGVIIQRHEITVEHTAVGSEEKHNIELKPINGTASSLWFKLPIVDHDGTYRCSGNKYVMRKQRCELPIRKINPTEVSLSSYYGKCFVSTENKVSTSASAWLLKQIEVASFSGSDWIKEIVPGDTFNSIRKTPYIYGLISTRFISLKAGDITLFFDNRPWQSSLTPEQEKIVQTGEMVLCGIRPISAQLDPKRTSQEEIWVDKNNNFWQFTNRTAVNIGDIYTLLKLNPHDSPIRFSELALFRKNIPVAVVLGYRLGWSNLLTLLKVKPRLIEPRKRLNLAPDEYPIPFLDGTYVFSQKDRFATMILAGMMEFAKITKNLELKDFEHQDVYLNLLSSKGLGAIYIREIDMLFDYFVDPITEEILQDMKEPTTFEGLLLRSTELLMNYYHPKNYDGAYTRIRGYERFSGAVYREMTASIRQFRSKNIAGRSKIDISPYKVWQSISEDQTKMIAPDINPLQDLKNDESLTYVGEGGRSSDGINKASRSFHISDIGVISESTVDNKEVGVNIYSSADPQIKNYRGVRKPAEEVKSTNRHSTPILLAPGVMHDDKMVIEYS